MSSLSDVGGLSDEMQAVVSRIEECQQNAFDLNSWEDTFLEDVIDKIQKRKIWSFSIGQEEKLAQIEDVCANGRSYNNG